MGSSPSTMDKGGCEDKGLTLLVHWEGSSPLGLPSPCCAGQRQAPFSQTTLPRGVQLMYPPGSTKGKDALSSSAAFI